ncbi:hypothetical protein ANAPC3_00490 [Anaplasma phagocytophilum]|nr:hypothetical protein ANAPC3_00490 [Anaplasma phagocytophilum]
MNAVVLFLCSSSISGVYGILNYIRYKVPRAGF